MNGTGEPSQMTLLRHPQRIESAAAAGLVYSVLSVLTLFILRSVKRATTTEQDWLAWIAEDRNRSLVVTALGMGSVSAVAFLWFVAVVRRRVGSSEDQFFSTVFLGSALISMSLWLVAVAVVASPAMLGTDDAGEMSWEVFRLARGTATGLLLVALPRIQAVFVASTSTVFLRSRAAPRWLAIFGYATALVMFVVPFVSTPVGLGMPAFVFVASVTMLLVSRTGDVDVDPTAGSASA